MRGRLVLNFGFVTGGFYGMYISVVKEGRDCYNFKICYFPIFTQWTLVVIAEILII